MTSLHIGRSKYILNQGAPILVTSSVASFQLVMVDLLGGQNARYQTQNSLKRSNYVLFMSTITGSEAWYTSVCITHCVAIHIFKHTIRNKFKTSRLTVKDMIFQTLLTIEMSRNQLVYVRVMDLQLDLFLYSSLIPNGLVGSRPNS